MNFFEIFILISSNAIAFTHVNSQQIWMNFNTLPSSYRINCVNRINFNLETVHEG